MKTQLLLLAGMLMITSSAFADRYYSDGNRAYRGTTVNQTAVRGGTVYRTGAYHGARYHGGTYYGPHYRGVHGYYGTRGCRWVPAHTNRYGEWRPARRVCGY